MPNPYMTLQDPRYRQWLLGAGADQPFEEPPAEESPQAPASDVLRGPAVPTEAIQASAPELARLISDLGPGATGAVSPMGERSVTIAPRQWTPPGEAPTTESGTASWTPGAPGAVSEWERRKGFPAGLPSGTYRTDTGVFTPRAEEERIGNILAEARARKEGQAADQKQELIGNILGLARNPMATSTPAGVAYLSGLLTTLKTLYGDSALGQLFVPKGTTVIDRETGQPVVEDPATVAGRRVAEIMSGGMGRTTEGLARQRDALRMIPLPTAQSLADDVQRRLDALEAAPGKKAQEKRAGEREQRDIETHGLTLKEFQAREQEHTERQKDREARRKRLEDAASGKNPLTARELMTDRSGLLAEQRRLEDRFDITEEEKQPRMRDIDEELSLVRGELEKARRRERGGAGQTLTPRQQAAVDAAPEGHRFRLGGTWHTKRGGQLVPEGK